MSTSPDTASLEATSMELENYDSAVAVLEEPWPTPSVATPKLRSTRYQSLDIWRGVACLMLVMYHATFYAERSWQSGDRSTWTLGGLAVNLLGRLWIGVPIFFVVSGYCIAASSDSSRRKTHSLKDYFVRRFRRIYPPLWIACGLCILLVLAIGTSEVLHGGVLQLPHLGELTLGNWIGNLTATEAWRTNVSGGETAYLLKNTWTLCYEEQFYAVVGLMLLLAGTRFFAAAGVVTLLTLAARHLSRAADTSLQGFFCDGHWLLFAIGILVYYRLHYTRGRTSWIALTAMAAIVIYAVADLRLSSSRFDKHLDEYLFIAGLFGILLCGLYRLDGHLANHRWLQPIASYGKMSYSVYLTHFPVVVLLGFLMARFGTNADWFVAAVTVPLSVAISIPLGRAFHLLVERHFMNQPQARSKEAPAS